MDWSTSGPCIFSCMTTSNHNTLNLEHKTYIGNLYVTIKTRCTKTIDNPDPKQDGWRMLINDNVTSHIENLYFGKLYYTFLINLAK